MNFLNAQFIQSYGLSQQLPTSDRAELVCCGRSNVGKSSLINKLCNRKALARVSGTPGKTTTINFFSLGKDVVLVDLPGYGYAKRSQSEKERWARLMEHYFSSGRDIKLVLLLLDSRHAPSKDDETMLAYLRDIKIDFFAVLTKTDKLTKTQLQQQLAFFQTHLLPYHVRDIVPFTVDGETSATVLRKKIELFCKQGECSEHSEKHDDTPDFTI